MPQGFARLLQKQGKNIDLRREKIAYSKRPLGMFDSNILCADCDAKLGEYDQYALKVCQAFGTSHLSFGREFEWKNVSGEQLGKFVLSVLWRASISKLPELDDVSFGRKYEAVARDVLFGQRRLSEFSQFELFLIRMTDDHFGLDGVEGFYTTPYRTKYGDLNAYSFALCGFKIVAKLDSRSFDQTVKPFLVREEHSIRGLFMELVDLAEFDSMAEMRLAQIRRGHELK